MSIPTAPSPEDNIRVSCTRKLWFCAGHRVMGHESKCAHLHGHNYTVFVTAEGIRTPQDDIGRVIDFSVLKALLDPWIQNNWDHGFILHQEDRGAIEAVRAFGNSRVSTEVEKDLTCQTAQKLFLLPYNPTAENLAKYLLQVVGPQLLTPYRVRLTSVRVWETINCYSDVEVSESK